MNDLFKFLFALIMSGLLAMILINTDLEDMAKFVIFYLGVKEIPKIFF